MSAPQAPDAPPLAPEHAELQAALRALHSADAQRLDPVRFGYLQALARRLPSAAPVTQRVLAGKLRGALADYQHRFAQAQQTRQNDADREAAEQTERHRERRQQVAQGHAPQTSAAPPAAGSPLRELQRHIQQARQAAAHDPDGGDASALMALNGAESPLPELRSVRRFRETWSRLRAEDQVKQAVGRGPENAGPLNSHMLVLRSLALMRERSPDYLRRFLAHVDALLWLEQAGARPKTSTAKPKPARAPRAKKSG